MNALSTLGYPLLGVGLLNLLLGAALASGRRRDPARPYAAAMALFNAIYCVTIGIAYVRASLGLDYEMFYRAAWVGWLAMAPIFQIVFVLEGKPRRARIWGTALYVLWGTVLALCLLTNWVEIGAVSLVPFVDRIGPLEQPLRALGAVTLVYALYEIWRAHRQSVGRRRQQTAYLLLGTGLYAVGGLLFAGVFQIVGGVRFDPGLVGYFSVGWVALTAYSIHRHRLFDVRSAISRGLAGVALSALFVLVEWPLYRLFARAVDSSAAVLLSSVCACVVFFMTPLATAMRRASEHYFFRHRYDYQSALKSSAQALAASLRTDDLVRALVNATQLTMRIASGAVMLLEDGRYTTCLAFGGAPSGALSLEGPLAGWLSAHGTIFVRDEKEGELGEAQLVPIIEDLAQVGGEVAVPIIYRGALQGIVVLGAKLDKDAYLQTDVDLLETLASEAGVALANARLLEEREQAIRTRDEFLSVAGHELRTPLTALHLNVQMMLDAAPTDERAQRRLSATDRQIARLSRLTNELLDVSRITTHHLTLEREHFDLAALADEVAARFAEELRRAGSTLERSGEGPVMGAWDRMRIEQVLGNLLSNAIKYGDGKTITLRIERVPSAARITVQDRGVGIAAVDQQRIFERFERAVSPTHYGGFGLGLWITKQVVVAHGGHITVDSEHGRGSTFIVELPTAAAEA